MLYSLLSALPQDYPCKEHIHYFETIDSTNTQAKAMGLQGAPHGTALVAKMQTAGRGRLGRSFHSPDSQGVYLSMVLRPGCHASHLMHLTCAVGCAVCDAIASVTGVRPGIKWTNDLVFGKRKLGGILTELSVDPKTGLVNYAIIGIGINCLQSNGDLPEQLQDIATSIRAAYGVSVSPAQLAAQLIISLHTLSGHLLTNKDAIMTLYKKDCMTLGKQIRIVRGDEEFFATATDIDPDGGLIVKLADESLTTVNSGEVSVRGMYGYL